MSDVLVTNAFKDFFTLNKKYINTAANYTPSGGGSPTAFATVLPGGITCTCGSISTGIATPFTSSWNSIPTLSNPVCGFKVCDTSGYYRCGASCSWTVPAGITTARFQLWGPGGSTSSNCCCGGAPFGPTGAYASVVMSVTPGDVYTLCAGCAYCCYATQTTPGLVGGPTYVTGNNLTGLCATSGYSNYCCWMNDDATITASGTCTTGCIIPGAGLDSCSGWNFCWSSQSGTGVYWSYSSIAKWAGSSTKGTVYGINGMWPLFCYAGSTLNGTYSISAPVYGFVNTSVKCFVWSGTTCNACCFSPLSVGASGAFLNPGSGGYASSVFGGCDACGGDAGRMGMVCVSMC